MQWQVPDIHHRKRETSSHYKRQVDKVIFSEGNLSWGKESQLIKDWSPSVSQVLPSPTPHWSPQAPGGNFLPRPGRFLAGCQFPPIYIALFIEICWHILGERTNLIWWWRRETKATMYFCLSAFLSFCRSEQLVELCWWKSWQGSDLWSLRLIGKSRHRLMRGNWNLPTSLVKLGIWICSQEIHVMHWWRNDMQVNWNIWKTFDFDWILKTLHLNCTGTNQIWSNYFYIL